MYPTDDQSNGRVGMPVSDQRRSLTPPTRDSAASRNAAADVIRGQLDAIYSRTEEQKFHIRKASAATIFRSIAIKTRSPIRTAQDTNSQTSANLNNAAVRAEKRHRQSRHAGGANCPNPDSAKATN